ncbi:rRNA N6-adenosine-methyltransferase ZCCHC4 [Osmia bicornis bicornis]|uniref:rRNA N6-adenosine-methyltransferase ZCCHC4 n=1 Tax=Osmia bicornis bicornis TaxID=1437191 RepID=UPI001EAEA3D0|nr:rRNA N6-adenosine-methyltransferase ZCCHC4 [Osmia bicornis bicornis]
MECIWSDPSKHPQCPHGPTLLFGKYESNELKKFYICSACRDRKTCTFYLKEGDELSKDERIKWEQKRKEYVSRYNHRSLYIRFNEVISVPQEQRCYCYTCELLICKNEENKHKDHEIKEGLTDYQLKHPTEILKPLTDSRQEAQYFFTKKSTEDIVNILLKLGAKQVLCICAPKIHEYISEKYENTMSSLLLDFDGRFHNFFGPLNYCWYNLLNNHFFNKGATYVFKDFVMQNKGRDTYVVCDPPFGSRVEPISWTLNKISDLHKKWNDIEDEKDYLKTMFIFPYFMESILKQKSNPVDISGGLKELKMTDYKVAYENHALFVTNSKTTKKLSPIRLFTNVPLHLIELPESDGYKYCKRCQKWVSQENKHCKKCKECTSKNGLTYKHCNECNRCVKPSWKHCKTCERCLVEKHVCGQKPKVTGKCFKCNKLGHVAKDCNTHEEDFLSKIKTKNVKKRKASSEKDAVNNIKKKKFNTAHKPDEEEKETPVTTSNSQVKKLKGKLKKMTPQPKVKTLKKSKLLTLKKKKKLNTQSNGIVKKNIKKQS